MIDFDHSLPMLMYRSLDAVMPAYRKLFATFDITEQQWRIMRVLWTSERVKMNELASRTLLPKPSMVGIVNRLESKALVARKPDKNDLRSVYLVATKKGKALETQISPLVAVIDGNLRNCITNAEWASLEKTLKKLTASIGKPG